MNVYEEKFKTKLNYNKTYREQCSSKIETISNKLDILSKNIASLEIVVNSMTETVVIDALQKQIDVSKKEHQQLVNAQENELKRLDQYRNELAFLQGLCPHEHAKVVSHDYHHNYDNYKCDLCGDLF